MSLKIYSIITTVIMLISVGFAYWQYQHCHLIPTNFVNGKPFNRVALIRQVGNGDGNAAFQLGSYYAAIRVPEASVFWFRKALELGDDQIKKETIDIIEINIIQEHM